MGGWFTKYSWRDPGQEEWTSDKEKELVRKICNIDKKTNEENIKNIKTNVLLCGPNNAGKSSFMNSAIGVLKGRQVHVSSAGSSRAEGRSLTKKHIRAATFNKFRLSDTPGLLESDDQGILIEDIIALLKGHIKAGYTFQEQKPIDKESEFYNKEPTADDLVHCLVFVFDAEKTMPPNYEQKIRTIMKKLLTEEIPFVIVLTKMDLIDEEVKRDIRKMHESDTVRAAIRKVSEKFGIQERSVFPVINHVKDIDIKPLTKIPHLLALVTILDYASDFYDVHISKDY